MGDIDYFLEVHKMESLREAEKSIQKNQPQLSKEQEKVQRKLKNKLAKIEDQISNLEHEIQQIDLELSANYNEVSSRPHFFEDYTAKKRKYEELMEAWELIEEELTNIS